MGCHALLQFLYLPISRNALISFMATTVPCDKQKLHETSRCFWKNTCLIACISPSTKISYVLTFSTYLFGAVSQSYLRCCFPGCGLHFPPNNTQLSTLTLFLFFKSTGGKEDWGSKKVSRCPSAFFPYVAANYTNVYSL